MLKAFFLLIFTFSMSSCLWDSQPAISPGGQVIANGSEITIEADKESISFVPAEILAKPGQRLKFKVVNDLTGGPINFLVLQKGEDPVVVSELAKQISSAKNLWFPGKDYTLARAAKVEPQKNQKISFLLPRKAEGVYYFVSTYPGQAETLHGKIIVKNKIQTEKEIKQEEEKDSLDLEAVNLDSSN